MPLLRIVDGGGAKADAAPAVARAHESERLFPDFYKGGHGVFLHVVAVSLILHGALILGPSLWSDAGDERAAGGSDEEIVIEGIDVVLFDQVPNVASPLVEAPEIPDADEAEAVAEADAALVEPQKPTALPPDRPTPASDDFPIKPSEAERADIGTAAATIRPSDDAAPQALLVETEFPAAALDVAETTTNSGEVAAARVIDTTAPAASDYARAAVAAPAENARPAPEETAQTIKSAKADTEAAAQAIEAQDVRPVARSADTVPRVMEDHAVARATPDAAPTRTAPEDDRLRPVDETFAVAAAEVIPDPPLPPQKPVDAPKSKATTAKQRSASLPSPSRSASAADPVAHGPGKAKAGAGGKTKTARGTANLASYQAKLVAHLTRHRSYPDAARRRRLEGSARVSFTINGSGRVVAVSLARSTGHAVLDREALAMVRRASPFPAIPAGLGKSRLTVRAPVRFDIR